MKHYLLLIFIFTTALLTAQNTFEYNLTNDVIFKVYQKEEGKFYKISNQKDFKQNTPEAVALSYFFASSNEIASKLYLDKKKYTPIDASMFDLIKKTKSKDAYIQLLHKTNYIFQGDEMAYIMFIAKVKDIPFPFPTLLSLIKKGNNWFIHQRPNQQKLTDCLMMFKPCVLSNLIQGESNDSDIEKLILKTKSKEGSIDFIKLFDELVIIQKNEQLANKLTAAQNLSCDFIQYKNEVTSKVIFTNLYKDLNVKIFKKQDKKLISLIKNKNDSIVLISKLEFNFLNKKYTSIKYKEISNSVETIKAIQLDNSSDIEQPAKELLFLFKNLKTKIFSDLTPSMNKKPIMETKLYKETRGVYQVLNISKMYHLFITERTLFNEYL
jgi:hypothetical protein